MWVSVRVSVRVSVSVSARSGGGVPPTSFGGCARVAVAPRACCSAPVAHDSLGVASAAAPRRSLRRARAQNSRELQWAPAGCVRAGAPGGSESVGASQLIVQGDAASDGRSESGDWLTCHPWEGSSSRVGEEQLMSGRG